MILSIDIGGMEAKYALIDEDNAIRAKYSIPTDFDGYETPVIDTVLKGVRRFTGMYPGMIDSVGVSAAGQIDTDTGVVIGTNGVIRGYEGIPIKARIEAEMKMSAFVLNDANAAALGECAAGSAKGIRNCVMVTLGTGIGGGIVIDGHIYNGARGIAGEIGLLPMYPGCIPPGGGRNGTYEGFASTRALVMRAQHALKDEHLTGRTICEKVFDGNADLKAIMDVWLDDVAYGLIGLVHIFNPEMLLIGGGISAQEELVIAPLRTRVIKGVMPRFAEQLKIERAALGNNAGLIGAAVYARQCKDSTLGK